MKKGPPGTGRPSRFSPSNAGLRGQRYRFLDTFRATANPSSTSRPASEPFDPPPIPQIGLATQVSVDSLQVWLLLHGLPAWVEHAPFRQESVPSQNSASLQAVPLGALAWTQPAAALQESAVQELPSSQLTAAWPQTWVAWLQVSVVQALPSLQSAAVRQQPGIAAWAQPVVGSQESAVQTFPSSQFSGVVVPHWRVDSSQDRIPLHTLWSSAQGFPAWTEQFPPLHWSAPLQKT